MATAVAMEVARRDQNQTFRLWGQIETAFRWGQRAFITLAGLGIFFLLLETARMYQTLSAIHPAIGIVSLVGVGLALGLVIWPMWRFLRMPRVIEPPPLPAEGKLDAKSLLREMRYLDRYLANCQKNPAFAGRRVAIASARNELATLLGKAKSTLPGAMEEQLAGWSTRQMAPVLSEVDARADRLIYQEALAVGLATAASPNGVLDAFVMLWRSVRLVSEIGVIYYGRPGLWGTLVICRDVSVAVALAGYLQNVSESLGNVVAGTVGKVGGMVAGPAVDGITNALVLIRIGYLAKERCRSYRRWDAATRKNAVMSALSATKDVAFGLSAEILRHVGWGVTAMAGGLASKLGEVGETAYEAAGTAAQTAQKVASDVTDAALRAAESARETARTFRDRVGDFFRKSPLDES